jgi:hypothetical protein
MSQKKHHNSAGKKQTPVAQKGNAPEPKKSRTGLIIVAVVAVLAVAAIVVSGLGGQKGTVLEPTAEEARYMGRLLPATYEPPTVAEPLEYRSVWKMKELTATLGDTQLTVPLADVTDARIVHFEYEASGAGALPLVAYVRPSGALFVGVSYCPPCQGEWQTIQADGTLTCNSCGTKRDLETMVGISGTCKLYPLDELPATIVDGNISIDRSAIDSWTPQPLDREVG